MKERRTLVLISLFFAACVFSGCGGSDSVQNVIQLAGGLGGPNNGAGGSGGSFTIEDGFYEIDAQTTGTLDISYNVTNPVGSLGDNPLIVSGEVTISIAASEPPTGTPYFGAPVESSKFELQGELYQVYISDGDGTVNNEPFVTGIQVNGGGTLTVEPTISNPGGTYAQILLDRDFINNGTVTSGVEPGGKVRYGLRIACASFINRGTIALQGVESGQSGGLFTADCDYGLHNMGPVNTYGADATNDAGGHGGEVNLLSNSAHVENTGKIDTHGGTSTSIDGDEGDGPPVAGMGGSVYLDASEDGSLYNSGAIMAYGGSGTINGFDSDFGADVEMVTGSGLLINTGAISTYGGDCLQGNGYPGGTVSFVSYRDMKIGGSIDTHGGDTLSLESQIQAGNAGEILFNSSLKRVILMTPRTVTLKLTEEDLMRNIEISANMIARGGNVPANSLASGTGGAGGRIIVGSPDYLKNIVLPSRLQLIGYGAILTYGGNGNHAGRGGSVTFGYDGGTLIPSDIVFTKGGLVTLKIENSIPIFTRGGNGTIGGEETVTAYGGYGGFVGFSAYGTINNSAPIDASGGGNINADMSYGSGASIEMYGESGISNTGDLYSRGGNDTGTAGGELGYGGNAGSVMLSSGEGTVTNNANIYASGGNGAFNGGNASGYAAGISMVLLDVPKLSKNMGIVLYGHEAVNSGGSIYANGGNADSALAGSTGGSGGYVEFTTANGPGAVTNGGITAQRGTGEADGFIDDIIVGGVLVQEHDYPDSI